jgi:hypothetical protein
MSPRQLLDGDRLLMYAAICSLIDFESSNFVDRYSNSLVLILITPINIICMLQTVYVPPVADQAQLPRILDDVLSGAARYKAEPLVKLSISSEQSWQLDQVRGSAIFSCYSSPLCGSFGKTQSS